jgi:hypothetical protein
MTAAPETVEARVASWVASCRGWAAENPGCSALARFDRAVEDMRHAGFRLPDAVVAGVRAALDDDGSAARLRLEQERWRLQNQFGRGAFEDGRLRERIEAIDRALQAAAPSR